MPPSQPALDTEPDRNPVLAYADSYRDMAKQGVESVPIWSVITDLERNIAPLYRHAQPAPVVPGKWIPVSERMPEVGVKVLCFPAEDEPIHAVFNGQLWLQDVSWSASYEPIDNVIPITVTHWMPLPAAPQEVNRE
ncbi:DUF551 domain-containing protein [Klebsiella pneumoniae]|uniref:DUF551 domain-containing protein n=1 Tax=Klebsiella pneumoniae TaxID=573 RepID=UPI0039F0A738